MSSLTTARLDQPLTTQELRVLVGLANGFTCGCIARSLWLSVETVRTHTKRIYRKFDVHDRDAAVAVARTRGVIL